MMRGRWRLRVMASTTTGTTNDTNSTTTASLIVGSAWWRPITMIPMVIGRTSTFAESG